MGIAERHSLERRILEYLQAHYPVSAHQLAGELGIPEKRALMELRRMASKGLVELDILPDTVFVRCLVVLAKGAGRTEGDGATEGQKKRYRGNDGKGAGGEDAPDPAYQ